MSLLKVSLAIASALVLVSCNTFETVTGSMGTHPEKTISSKNGRDMDMSRPDTVLIARGGSHYASATISGKSTYWVYTAYADMAGDGATARTFSIDGLTGCNVTIITNKGASDEKTYTFTNAWFVQIPDLQGSEDIRIYLENPAQITVAVQYQ